MDKDAVAAWLNGLTDKQFVEFFYEHLSSRYIYTGEEEITKSHLVLANAVSCDEGDFADYSEGRKIWSAWKLELLCPTPDEKWIDDVPICQNGKHCGIETASWAKTSACPICGGDVHGT